MNYDTEQEQQGMHVLLFAYLLENKVPDNFN